MNFSQRFASLIDRKYLILCFDQVQVKWLMNCAGRDLFALDFRGGDGLWIQVEKKKLSLVQKKEVVLVFG